MSFTMLHHWAVEVQQRITAIKASSIVIVLEIRAPTLLIYYLDQFPMFLVRILSATGLS